MQKNSCIICTTICIKDFQKFFNTRLYIFEAILLDPIFPSKKTLLYDVKKIVYNFQRYVMASVVFEPF